MFERQHAAPRRAEQVDPVEPLLGPDRRHLVAEQLEIPLDAAGTVGRSAAELVVDDNGAVICQALERAEVVVCRTGPAVQREQRYAPSIAVADNAIPRPVAAERDVALFLGGAVR